MMWSGRAQVRFLARLVWCLETDRNVKSGDWHEKWYHQTISNHSCLAAAQPHSTLNTSCCSSLHHSTSFYKELEVLPLRTELVGVDTVRFKAEVQFNTQVCVPSVSPGICWWPSFLHLLERWAWRFSGFIDFFVFLNKSCAILCPNCQTPYNTIYYIYIVNWWNPHSKTNPKLMMIRSALKN